MQTELSFPAETTGVRVLTIISSLIVQPVKSVTDTVSVTDFTGCTISDEIIVSTRTPVVSAGKDSSVCILALNVTLKGVPAGGSWAGNGVSGFSFDPAAAGTGIHLISYS